MHGLNRLDTTTVAAPVIEDQEGIIVDSHPPTVHKIVLRAPASGLDGQQLTIFWISASRVRADTTADSRPQRV